MEFSIKRVTKIAELMAEEMREKLGEGVQVAEIEQGLRELAREVSGVGLQKMIEESEEKYGSRVTCTCGQEAEPTGKRGAMVWSVFGKVSYTRRYYLCAHCHRGQSPLDQRLGLQPGESTSGLASLLGILGVETSFEEASDLAERFLLFRVSDNTVRKHTEGYGTGASSTGTRMETNRRRWNSIRTARAEFGKTSRTDLRFDGWGIRALARRMARAQDALLV